MLQSVPQAVLQSLPITKSWSRANIQTYAAFKLHESIFTRGNPVPLRPKHEARQTSQSHDDDINLQLEEPAHQDIELSLPLVQQSSLDQRENHRVDHVFRLDGMAPPDKSPLDKSSGESADPAAWILGSGLGDAHDLRRSCLQHKWPSDGNRPRHHLVHNNERTSNSIHD